MDTQRFFFVAVKGETNFCCGHFEKSYQRSMKKDKGKILMHKMMNQRLRERDDDDDDDYHSSNTIMRIMYI